MMEQWERKGFKGFFERFRKRKLQLKTTVDEATCRAIKKRGFGGASERQRVQTYGNPYQRHVDRR